MVCGGDNTPMRLDGTAPDVANMVVIDGGPGFVKSTGGARAGTFNIEVQPYFANKYRKCFGLESSQNSAEFALSLRLTDPQ